MTICGGSWDSFTRINAGQRFRRQSAAMGRALTETIVSEAQIAPHLTVLDVASGSGEPAISVAALMNGTGHVVATDISPSPLKVAEQRAHERGLNNIEFLPADVHHLPFPDFSFDRILCRLGVMFFADPPCAFAELYRVLKPKGRATLLAWGSMHQPYFETTIGTILRILPELKTYTASVNMFRYGSPGALVSQLQYAGFQDIEEKIIDLPWNWPGTPEELWEYFQEVTIPFKPLLQAIPDTRRDDINSEVLKILKVRSDGNEVKFSATVVIASAVK